MKKVILFAALCISLITSYAQEQPVIVHSNVSEVGNWNDYTKSWSWSDAMRIDLTFYVYDYEIRVNDRAHSVYKIITKLEPITGNEYIAKRWQVRDEENRICEVHYVKYDDGQSCLSVMYNNKIFKYWLSKTGYSDF